jgi:hypothetical protein
MSAVARTKVNLNEVFAQALDTSIRKHGEVGLHVVIYQDGEPMVDVWGGIADPRTGRKVDAETLFPAVLLGAASSHFIPAGKPRCTETPKTVNQLTHLREACRMDFRIKMKSCEDRTSPIIATLDNISSSRSVML